MVIYLGPVRHSLSCMEDNLYRILLNCGKWMIWKSISQNLFITVYCYLFDYNLFS
jgi:hypothetical protein